MSDYVLYLHSWQELISKCASRAFHLSCLSRLPIRQCLNLVLIIGYLLI